MAGKRHRICIAAFAMLLATGAFSAPVSVYAADDDYSVVVSAEDAESVNDAEAFTAALDSVEESADVEPVVEESADEEIGEAAFTYYTESSADDVEAQASFNGETITLNGTFRWDFAAQELDCLNQQRTANGKSKLKMDKALQKTAMQRAAEIVVYFDHTRPDGSDWSTAMPDYWSAGENLAKGQTSPSAVTTSWMKSKGHRANILSTDYTYVGVCCFYYNGTYFWVQSFSDVGSESYVSKSSAKGSVSVKVSYDLVSKTKVDKIKAQNPSSGSSSSGNSGSSSSSGNSGNSGNSSNSGNSTSTTVITMYRLYNPWSGEHLYTSNLTEVSKCKSAGWKYEGVAWYAPKSSSTPVYRLYNKYSGDHHYTTSKAEYDACGKSGWTKEGIGWYSESSSGVPLYRGYNKYVSVGTHHYTTNWSEMQSMEKVGWKYEGIAWYGVK